MSGQLLQLLEPTAILTQITCGDKREVIERLGERLMAAGYVKDGFLDGVLDREGKMPTGLPLDGESNAAIPHTDVIHVERPGVAVATLNQPVTFQNMIEPDEPVAVRLVFLLALKEPKSQVEMLQEIAEILQDGDKVSRLLNAQTPNELILLLRE
ncbi:MAG: PTS sugar transporter subunit IIA [Ardenticatenaceae bacterium]|nr:PTS sugar transporter subunit IIA [Ardenticatenaceae bacterium]